ncbi:hypothetical protein PHLCEN_2v9669, partial [Hermanssonia centrifuga]
MPLPPSVSDESELLVSDMPNQSANSRVSTNNDRCMAEDVYGEELPSEDEESEETGDEMDMESGDEVESEQAIEQARQRAWDDWNRLRRRAECIEQGGGVSNHATLPLHDVHAVPRHATPSTPSRMTSTTPLSLPSSTTATPPSELPLPAYTLQSSDTASPSPAPSHSLSTPVNPHWSLKRKLEASVEECKEEYWKQQAEKQEKQRIDDVKRQRREDKKREDEQRRQQLVEARDLHRFEGPLGKKNKAELQD